jgi:hypothetical protein
MKKTIIVYSVFALLLLLTFREIQPKPNPKNSFDKVDTIDRIDTINGYPVLHNTILLDEVVVIGHRPKPDSIKTCSLSKKI